MSAEIKEAVKAHYAEAARKVLSAKASCCEPAPKSSCCSTAERIDPITVGLYEPGETAGLPEEAVLASLGCGNPAALAELREGEVVLDLDYAEDSTAQTDANFVITGSGGLVEIQATAEAAVFSPAELNTLLALAQKGVADLIALQKAALA